MPLKKRDPGLKRYLQLIFAAGLLMANSAVLSATSTPLATKAIVNGQLTPPAFKVDSLGFPEEVDKNQRLSLEAKLFYTTLLGRPVGLSSAELAFDKLPRNLSYAGFSFAVAARQALQLHNNGTGSSISFLNEFLSGTTEPYPIKDLPKDLPQGMHADDLAMLHIYALVMSNQTESLIQLLEKHLQSKTDFTRHFAIMALRSIGTDRARELIKSRVSDAIDSVMARDALGFVVPNFFEPKRFAGDVQVTQRFRQTMLAQAKQTTTASILPTFLLAFVGEDEEPQQLQAERDFFMDLYKSADNALWRKYVYGYATLAFRFKVPYDHWVNMYTSDQDPFRRAFILRSMARQHPDQFFQKGLKLFEKEKNGSVQLEFFSLYSNLIEGGQLTGPYDAIWMPNLRYRITYPWKKSGRKRSTAPIFEAWANGRIAEDTHWPVWMADLMGAKDEAKFLLGYLRMKNRDAYSAYALMRLKDRRMLPVMRYIKGVEKVDEVKKATDDAIKNLEGEDDSASTSCCDANDACLQQLILSTAISKAKVTTMREAQHYLRHLPPKQVKLEFLDALKERAKVSGSGASATVWEYQRGCWRPVTSDKH